VQGEEEVVLELLSPALALVVEEQEPVLAQEQEAQP